LKGFTVFLGFAKFHRGGKQPFLLFNKEVKDGRVN